MQRVILFCLTFLLSAFGYEFLIFLMTIHVYEISKKAFAVGIFITLTFIPKIFSPFYGLLVDRYNRKNVMALNALIVGVLVLAIGYTTNINHIYSLWFLASIFIMFIGNARTALMTDVMSGDNLLLGNSLVLSFLNLAKLIAPLLGGLVIQFADKSLLIVLTSIAYFICMILSFLIKLEERESPNIKGVGETWLFLKEGIQFIWDNEGIKKLLYLGIYWRLFLGMQFSLFVVYVTGYLGKSEGEYGVFMTLAAFGSLVGSFLGPFIAKKFNVRTHILVGLSLHFISFSILGLIHNYLLALVIVTVSYMAFYGTVLGIHVIRDNETNQNLRGRVYGSITSVLTPPTIISMLVSGYLADMYGVEKVFIASGILSVISLYIIMSNFKSIEYRVKQYNSSNL